MLRIYRKKTPRYNYDKSGNCIKTLLYTFYVIDDRWIDEENETKSIYLVYEFPSMWENVYNEQMQRIKDATKNGDTKEIESIKKYFCYAENIYVCENQKTPARWIPEASKTLYSIKEIWDDYEKTQKSSYEHLTPQKIFFEELDGRIEDWGLKIPDIQTCTKDEIKIIKKVSPVVENMKNLKMYTSVSVSFDLDKRPASAVGTKGMFKTYCSECSKIVKMKVNKDNIFSCKCPNCGTDYSSNYQLLDKKILNLFSASYYPILFRLNFREEKTHSKKQLYVRPYENGVDIYKVSRTIGSENGTVVDDTHAEYLVRHIIGGEMFSKKILKNSEKECDAMEALGINKNSLSGVYNAVYEDADDFDDFVRKNSKMLKKIGFIEILKYSTGNHNIAALFFLYMAIVNMYPVVEQIVKSGYAKFFFSLYEKLKGSYMNVKEIKSYIKGLEEIVNVEENRGKCAMRFPSYIGDYLIKKGADIDEYYLWRDIYEISNLSKEQFEAMLDSYEFSLINAYKCLPLIGNVLKYGYKPMELFKYVVKQKKSFEEKGQNNSYYCVYDYCREVLVHLKDYLQMCEFVGVTPDMFPMNIKKQHDDILEVYDVKKNEEMEKEEAAKKQRLRDMGEAAEKYLLVENDEKIGVPNTFNDYVVVFPKSQEDFINEGNAMHNCVGGYYRNVMDGSCIIFFLRKKEDPDKSYITGQCFTSGMLGQFYLSNNRIVKNTQEITIGKYIAKRIARGISSGKIPKITQ